jgi:hypothetical protein
MNEQDKLIHITTPEEHRELMAVMHRLYEEDNGKPKVGLFWYDPSRNRLFGVVKEDAENYVYSDREGTICINHSSFWEERHRLAVNQNLHDSVFAGADYVVYPRGRIFVRPDRSLYVVVDTEKHPCLFMDRLRELLCEEFNLPEEVELVEGMCR